MPGASSFLDTDQLARKDEVMIRAIPALIIASAGLWLTLPAAAQSEIDPEHFGIPATAVVEPRPQQFKEPMRISLQQKQVQRHRVQASTGTRNPETTRWAFSNAAAAQPNRVFGATRIARENSACRTPTD